jgi:hypothetical protein
VSAYFKFAGAKWQKSHFSFTGITHSKQRAERHINLSKTEKTSTSHADDFNHVKLATLYNNNFCFKFLFLFSVKGIVNTINPQDLDVKIEKPCAQ